MASNKVTRGAVAAKLANELEGPFVVQVVKPERASGGKWKAEVSDGESRCAAFFAAANEAMFESEEVSDKALIRILSLNVTKHQGASVMIVLRMEVVESGASAGSYVTFEPVSAEKIQPEAVKTPGASASPVARVTKTPSKAPVARTDAGLSAGKTTPIMKLNPYQNRWTLKARLTTKGEVISYANQRGSGELMKITLTDAAGDDIEAVMFNAAVKKFRPQLDEDKVYLVSGGRIKAANRQYSSTSSNYELSLDTSSRIQECPEDGSIGKTRFDFKTISEIRETAENETVDVIAVVKSHDDVREVTSKAGKALYKRELALVDEALVEIRLTLWGEQARAEPHAHGTVLACKGLRVSDFGGKSLGCLRSSKVVAVTDFDDDARAKKLRDWYFDEGGAEAQTTQVATAPTVASPQEQQDAFYAADLDTRATVGVFKTDESLGRQAKPDWVSFKATVSRIKEDKLWYEACPTCQRKVSENHDGTYTCEKCNTTLDDCSRRYLLSAMVADDTNNFWISAFNDVAALVFGASADELAALQDDDNAAFLDKIATTTHRQFLFRCRCKQETWNDVARLKVTAVAAAPVDFKRESAALLAAIHKKTATA